MIEFITGKLLIKYSNYIIVDVSGIGYKIHITLNSFNKLCQINESISIETFFHVTENSQTLYGFKEKLEKEIFEMLISVSGIGPKTAIGLLSAVKPEEFKKRLIAGEVKMLTSLPGIGSKTAKRIIIELKDKFVKSRDDELPLDEDFSDMDAYFALLNLGFKSNNIKNVINKITFKKNNINTADLIKESLKILR